MAKAKTKKRFRVRTRDEHGNEHNVYVEATRMQIDGGYLTFYKGIELILVLGGGWIECEMGEVIVPEIPGPDITAVSAPLLSERIQAALNLVAEYGGADGVHHKQWVLDQMILRLCGSQDAYDMYIGVLNSGGIREWDRGIAP